MLTGYSSAEPSLQIEVVTPEIRVEGSKKFVQYMVKVKTTLPIFPQTESIVQRRYSEFEWLHNELERADVHMTVPKLPDKAWKRQLPFQKDNGLFQDEFIEERRRGLEIFINKVSSHPLAQTERALHMFLFDPQIDLAKYVRGRVKS